MLLDKNMLPSIKRDIPQMTDLLQAEQTYLDVILDMTEWLSGRMELLREDGMTIPNLKVKIKQITGWNCEILEDPEHLTLIIRYYFDAQEPVLKQKKRILMYVPAHLKVIHQYLQAYLGNGRIYMGTGLGGYIKYVGYPQEVNGVQEGTARVEVVSGLYVYSKLIGYPEE